MSFPAKNSAQATFAEKRSLGRGVFRKCRGCGAVQTEDRFARCWQVCPDCGYHHPLDTRQWRELLLDQARLDPWDEQILPTDPLGFDDGTAYAVRLERAARSTDHTEAIEVGRASIDARAIAYGCYVFGFMGGSMGSVVGERITRLFERAAAERLPVVLLHSSGGARMQEGILSLMQMAKT
ncbi:MAG: acetyl-CoA carboxylase carboxyl transferase subunit beta, partial [Polyangiaceae bacterium]|nr:acetyl-CoA carboxylase carboxyl transferase subunit beta [Polyangiaceae bacterium]